MAGFLITTTNKKAAANVSQRLLNNIVYSYFRGLFPLRTLTNIAISATNSSK
ncbi:hypothetical protein NU09_1037 [Flavobacterium beibuense]|uniref:Uncharacterized protein n=1 Tax=Flavobacterium beibuense TaxID=657326 RepID=A0A444WF27_9FLAO|nr:hypothetical protein NU09_1037 [Flavobacterium beibuense]